MTDSTQNPILSKSLSPNKTTAAGLFFILIGSLFAYWSADYNMGTSNAMGPGYLPVLVSWLLILCGLVQIVKVIFWNYLTS